MAAPRKNGRAHDYSFSLLLLLAQLAAMAATGSARALRSRFSRTPAGAAGDTATPTIWYFYHKKKTGGSALSDQLKRNCAQGLVIPGSNPSFRFERTKLVRVAQHNTLNTRRNARNPAACPCSLCTGSSCVLGLRPCTVTCCVRRTLHSRRAPLNILDGIDRTLPWCKPAVLSHRAQDVQACADTMHMRRQTRSCRAPAVWHPALGTTLIASYAACPACHCSALFFALVQTAAISQGTFHANRTTYVAYSHSSPAEFQAGLAGTPLAHASIKLVGASRLPRLSRLLCSALSCAIQLCSSLRRVVRICIRGNGPALP